jgi:hypothetical protein
MLPGGVLGVAGTDDRRREADCVGEPAAGPERSVALPTDPAKHREYSTQQRRLL